MATRKRLSAHFRIEEFDCHDGTQIAAHNYDDVARLVEWWLEPLRSEFGPVVVVSGFRTLSHNRFVGGAQHSVHLLKTPLPGGDPPSSRGASHRSTQVAAAADVVPARGNPKAWAEWSRRFRPRHGHLGKRGRGGVGLYVAGGFIHLDTGPARDWHG